MSRTAESSSPGALLQARLLHIAGSGTFPLLELDLDVHPGELQLVFSQDRMRTTAIVDGLLGLGGPARGDVQCLGRAWKDLTPQAANRLRGSIGRALSRGNWMSGRSVMESVLLPIRHHTVLPDDVLREMACDLAQQFGLPGLPTLPPHQCPESDLQRAACIRAFLGRPQLVFLEHPLDPTDYGFFLPLMEVIQQTRRRQGAVIWFTRNRELFENSSVPADKRLRITGGRLLDAGIAA